MDTTDTLTAGLATAIAWALSALVRHFVDETKFNAVRHVLPTVAILLAVGVVAGGQAVQGEALTWASFLRGLSAGAMAVFAHSQYREVVKGVQATKGTGPETVPVRDPKTGQYVAGPHGEDSGV